MQEEGASMSGASAGFNSLVLCDAFLQASGGHEVELALG